ncbi:protein of unknown function [Methylorubrum extorquens DM4]|uniref:Uncharacterized protein n=1 Tax=Methylorubrum extorquens (strain DSM 6343 / CIP 106787 / DM4) TaxID=661410 RepID=C7CI95_METED|nr:protein of unknown function [Methylorubrum extorquens DM4]
MPCFATGAMPPSLRSLRSDFGGGSGNHACRTRAEPEHKGRQAYAMGALLKVARVLGVIPGPGHGSVVLPEAACRVFRERPLGRATSAP